jgi:threonine/homoserine/homoserine lactone efflux protein
MIDPGRVAALAATAFVLIVIPGPGVLFIVSRGVSLGRRAALATVVGHWAGLMTQVAAVAAGIGAIVERSIAAFTLLKLIGAAYLVWLGIDAIRHRRRLALASEASRPLSTRRILRDGYIVGVSNPKGFLLFASILPQFVTPNGAPVPLQLILLGLVCGAIALVSDSVWALAAGTARNWLARSPRHLARIGAAGGVATIGLGIRLAVTGRHD